MNSRGLGSGWKRTATAMTIVGLVCAGLTACGFGSRSPYDDVPQLEAAWTAPLGDEVLTFEKHTATKDLWIAFEAGSSQLFALRLADGSVAWTIPGRHPCGFSEVNADGLLAVRSGTRSSCDRVDLIDTRAGKQLWSTEVGVAMSNPEAAGQVGLSDQTVSATGACGVDRWEARSGRKLATLAASEKYEDVPGHCRSALTSTDVAVIAEARALVGYDVDTGEKRWTQEGDEPEIGSLHSTDPLVAEVQVEGVTGLRTLDPASGEVGPVIGRPKKYVSHGSVTVVGDRVVGTYRGAPEPDPDGTYRSALRAWDPDSGEELANWPGGRGEDYLGVGERGVYQGRTVPDGTDRGTTAYWVTRADWSGKAPRTVGWIDDNARSPIVVGDLLLDPGYGELPDGAHGQRVVAYRLPANSTADPIPRPMYAEKVTWAKGDVRPDPTVDPCAEVSDETLRGLGFDALLDREVPLDCGWSVGSTIMSTAVEVMMPDSESSAIVRAEEAVAAARQGMEAPVAVDGLGDDAWAEVVTGVASGQDETFEFGDVRTTHTWMRVTVRQKNVVAHVMLEDRAEPGDGSLPPALSAREARVVDVLADVIGAAGTRLTRPAVADDGPITQLPDMCDAVDSDVRKVLPGAKPASLDANGDRRLRGCLWTTRSDGFIHSHVQVVAYAVGASPLTGTTGTAAAEKVFAENRGDLATSRRDNDWDESAMAADHTSRYRNASHFIGRNDNVVLVVDINLRDRDKPAAPSIALRISDNAMKAIRR